MEETRREKGGREEPEEDIWWTSDKKIYNTGQPVEAQKPRKLKADAVGVSNIRRPKRQELRDENKGANVRWEKSLNVQNVQRERGESAGGAGQ